ncbi:Fe-S cluster assembly iron-binding protein IscA [Lentzea flaviverrucosa]|uniref:Fe-S cluster assembly iron-binding protein IscA n=2 Tax=Lentzea flaviverrucosa TaxID=200379 RepID=A0A1H9BD13_9PSEU|nr:Fe-S cluster assembly iron-binding protein IscA [Lentzea flaviverrucosa]SEP86930.1 Fe-S cluster assembly iron-binding protein IscA [Lentzea flaviverrucosa]
MLEMTSVAAAVIRDLMEGEGRSAGLRLDFADGDLHVTRAAGPEEGDEVVTARSGERVFVTPDSADYLDDKVLDARADTDGTPVFGVSRR